MRVLSCSLRSLRGVNFVVTRPDGKVLVQKRCALAPKNPNMYCFPGGGIEGDEDPFAAVVREAYEETGYLFFGLSSLCDIEYMIDGAVAHNRVFWVRTSMETDIESKEGEMQWKSVEELEGIVLALGENVLIPTIKEVIYGSLI